MTLHSAAVITFAEPSTASAIGLAGKSHRQIAAALSDPASPIALAVDGSANVITAALCKVTGQQPTPVCSAPGVTAAAKTLAQGNK